MSSTIEVGKSYIREDDGVATIAVTLDGGKTFLTYEGFYYDPHGKIITTPNHRCGQEEFLCLSIKIMDGQPQETLTPVHSEIVQEQSLIQLFDRYRQWGEKTFGDGNAASLVKRAQKEMDELAIEAENGWTEEALEEAADVILILTRAPGFAQAILRKQKINMDRKWELHGDGTGSHIREGVELSSPGNEEESKPKSELEEAATSLLQFFSPEGLHLARVDLPLNSQKKAVARLRTALEKTSTERSVL